MEPRGDDPGGISDHSSHSERSPRGAGDPGVESEPETYVPRGLRAPGRPEPLATHCGALPAGFTIADFHAPPSKVHARNVEGLYWKDFASQVREAFPHTSPASTVTGPDETWNIPGSDARSAAERQLTFFKCVDKLQLDPAGLLPTRQPAKDQFDRSLDNAIKRLPSTYTRSDTVVMETAFFLLQQGLLNIPDVGTVNVKQARAFLWNAAWLQEHMSATWRETAMLPTTCHREQKFKQFCLAILGPGGTGKTAVLKLTEALIVFFAGPDTVRKMAPSNAAW